MPNPTPPRGAGWRRVGPAGLPARPDEGNNAREGGRDKTQTEGPAGSGSFHAVIVSSCASTTVSQIVGTFFAFNVLVKPIFLRLLLLVLPLPGR